MTQFEVRPLVPSHSKPLTDAEYQNACAIADRLRAILDTREETLERHGLEHAVFLPGNIWDDDFPRVCFENMAGKDRSKMDRLRLFGWPFTGFQLIRNSREDNQAFTEIPADIDNRIIGFLKVFPSAYFSYPMQTKLFTEEPVVRALDRFGECGFVMNGMVVNFDTWTTWMQLNALLNAGVLNALQSKARPDRPVTIVEIGSGYGNTALEMVRLFPNVRYACIDLTESLIYSSIYLSTLRPELGTVILDPRDPNAVEVDGNRLMFAPNHALPLFKDQIGAVDLALNFRSLAEMTADQVTYYAREMASMLTEDGLFLEQNFLVPNHNTDVAAIFKTIFSHYLVVPERLRTHLARGEARLWAKAPLPLPEPLVWEETGAVSVMDS